MITVLCLFGDPALSLLGLNHVNKFPFELFSLAFVDKRFCFAGSEITLKMARDSNTLFSICTLFLLTVSSVFFFRYSFSIRSTSASKERSSRSWSVLIIDTPDTSSVAYFSTLNHFGRFEHFECLAIFIFDVVLKVSVLK